MKLTTQNLLLAGAGMCAALLGYALFLQHVHGLAPCPLCVMQRYAFLAVGVGCLLGAFTNKIVWGAAYALIAALVGAGIAGHHLWIKAHPLVSCGIDPLETMLNRVWPAVWLPSVFKADGLCSAEHAPILGLSIPAWSLVWFVVFAVMCALVWVRALKKTN